MERSWLKIVAPVVLVLASIAGVLAYQWLRDEGPTWEANKVERECGFEVKVSTAHSVGDNYHLFESTDGQHYASYKYRTHRPLGAEPVEILCDLTAERWESRR